MQWDVHQSDASEHMSIMKAHSILVLLACGLVACSTQNSVREHYHPTAGLGKKARDTDAKKFTFSVARDFPTYSAEAQSLISQGYYVLGTSIWVDQDTDNYLKQSIDVRSENNADVVLVNEGFDHEDDVVFDMPPPVCCSKPLLERRGDCDCCKKQQRIKRYWYRHVIQFFAK